MDEIKEIVPLREAKIKACDTLHEKLTSVGNNSYKMLLNFQPIVRRFLETLQSMKILLETHISTGDKLRRENRIGDLNISTLLDSMGRFNNEIRENVQDIEALMHPYFDKIQPLMQEADEAIKIISKPYPVIPYKARNLAETSQEGQLLEKRYYTGPTRIEDWQMKSFKRKLSRR